MPLCYAMLCCAAHYGKFCTHTVLIYMCEVTERKETIYVNAQEQGDKLKKEQGIK